MAEQIGHAAKLWPQPLSLNPVSSDRTVPAPGGSHPAERGVKERTLWVVSRGSSYPTPPLTVFEVTRNFRSGRNAEIGLGGATGGWEGWERTFSVRRKVRQAAADTSSVRHNFS